VAIASGVAWLLLRTAAFEGRPHAALEARAVWRAALDTWPGRVWIFRHGLLLVLTAFLTFRADVDARVNWLAARGEAFALAALALVLVSGAGHAAAVAPGTASAVVVDALHLLGAGLWAGALAPLALLLLGARRETRADGVAYALRATRRFSRVALVTMLALTGTGVASAAAQVATVAGLVGTTHGRLLLAKLALLVPILVLAAASRRRLPSAPLNPGAAEASPLAAMAVRRLSLFVGLEAALALALIALAAAMAVSTPARHADPVWPWPFRLSLDALRDTSPACARALVGGILALAGTAAAVAAFRADRRRGLALGAAAVLGAAGAGVSLPPLVVDAYPTTYRRPLVTYDAGSVARGRVIYQAHCAACHGGMDRDREATRVDPWDLRARPTSERPAGELFWLITHGRPRRGMPGFERDLEEADRWHVINYVRALDMAANARGTRRGTPVLQHASLVAPDFLIAVGPLQPRALRDHRGRRLVMLVLYTLPGSRSRMAALARSYSVLSTLGVEIVAVPPQASSEAIRELDVAPPALFPVVTDGNADIVRAYRVFAPGSEHAEFLIDRQGYVRAIWRDGRGAPDTAAVQAEVERLNAEEAPPPFPDDHVH
jgi:putative copper resistance protein D